MTKESILSYGIDCLTVSDCVSSVMDKLGEQAELSWLACFNPHSYAVARTDTTFEQALRAATWLVPDGVGVLVASRILGGGIKERVTGSDIFSCLNERMNSHGGFSVFFLGASDETLAKIRQRMGEDYPRLRLAGTYSPPFKPVYSSAELDEIIHAINQAQPDVLWVGMTAPKQEKWIFENRHRMNVRFAGAIGAVFDFYVGNVKRSNPVFQRLGLEWLPRLVQQPRRLWKRMFVSAPIFIWHVIKQAAQR